MTAALILYGSRARGEASAESDVDLIFAEDGTDARAPCIAGGVSVHRYSKGWLLERARDGALFVYHVAFEGVSLCDQDDFLGNLQRNFRKKLSYSEERLEALLILRMLLESDWHLNRDLQRRYFWAIRTVLICFSADCGDPCFASSRLEELSGVIGLAGHINRRVTETYSDCLIMGRQIEERFGAELDMSLSGARLRNYLASRGGISRDSVHLVEHQDMSELGVNVMYL